MLLHIVLFRPRPDVSTADRAAMFDALKTAATKIPSVRRFRVGRRVIHGSPYERLSNEDFPYALVAEFDDLQGLKSYLEHPDHHRLGQLFYALMERGLAFDYEIAPSVFDVEA